MKKKILIISGGISKERIISLDTGKQVSKELINRRYKVKITEPDFKLLEIVKSFKPDIIFYEYFFRKFFIHSNSRRNYVGVSVRYLGSF